LPADIRDLSISKSVFKKKLKTFLFILNDWWAARAFSWRLRRKERLYKLFLQLQLQFTINKVRKK
jgi:hypothetical protein